MLNTQVQGPLGKVESHESAFDARVKLFRSSVMMGLGLFVGTVLGGVCGLFVYANSRTPNQHDGVYIVIQALGIIAGVAMGYFSARNAEAQEDLIEAAQKAGGSLLRRYKPKPGTAGNSNVGQRTIGANKAGEDFLKTLLAPK